MRAVRAGSVLAGDRSQARPACRRTDSPGALHSGGAAVPGARVAGDQVLARPGAGARAGRWDRRAERPLARAHSDGGRDLACGTLAGGQRPDERRLLDLLHGRPGARRVDRRGRRHERRSAHQQRAVCPDRRDPGHCREPAWGGAGARAGRRPPACRALVREDAAGDPCAARPTGRGAGVLHDLDSGRGCVRAALATRGSRGAGSAAVGLGGGCGCRKRDLRAVAPVAGTSFDHAWRRSARDRLHRDCTRAVADGGGDRRGRRRRRQRNRGDSCSYRAAGADRAAMDGTDDEPQRVGDAGRARGGNRDRRHHRGARRASDSAGVSRRRGPDGHRRRLDRAASRSSGPPPAEIAGRRAANEPADSGEGEGAASTAGVSGRR